MGLYDRDYTREDHGNRFGDTPHMRMGFPRITPMVKRLLIINIAIFLVGLLIKPLGDVIYHWFQLDATSVPRALQLWRLITYQFLHSPVSLKHIIYNMIGLFFLGPALERHWNSKRFLVFYLGCGMAGGLFYLLLVAVGFLPAATMVGASGAILGMLAACAILFPHFIVFFFFFPLPIRVLALILTFLYVGNLFIKGGNAGGDAAHLAGMAAGAIYVLSESWRSRVNSKIQTQTWQKKMDSEKDLEVQVDRILQKIHESGIQSLSPREKRILRQATEAERTERK
jgi:membrane associated rhomboid family serine protease